MTSSSRANYVMATRSTAGAAAVVQLVTMLALLLPQQLVLMLAVNQGSAVTSASVAGPPAAAGSLEPEQVGGEGKQWTADDVDQLSALKASRHRQAAADLVRQLPNLGGGGGKRRAAHIFVGKRSKMAELAAAEDDVAGVDYDEDGLPEVVVKRPRMFVGKRPAINNEDIVDGDVYAADDWLQSQREDIEKRPRMFVGKRKAPVFVGKRSVDAVLQPHVAP